MASDKKEIEIKLKATGADSAADEIKKVEASIDDLGGSTSDSVLDIDDATDAIDDMADGMLDAGRASGGLGSRLVGLAGGPVAIVLTAVTALAGWLASLKQRLEAAAAETDALRDSTAALRDRIHEFQNPVADATLAIEAHGAAMDLLVEKSEVANAQFDRRRQELDKTREAEIAYRKALIDRQVAEGNLSAAEAAVQKGELDKESIDRENAAALQSAQDKIAATEAALQAARAEVAAAKEALRLEKGKTPETESARLAEEAGRAASAARLKAEAAEAAREEKIKRAALAGGLAGPGGAAVAGGLEAKAQAELVEKLNAEAAAREADAAKFLEQAEAERAAREALIAAKQAEVDAALAAAKALADQQKQATEELRAADLAAKLAEAYVKPTVDLGTEGRVGQIQAKEAAEKAKAEEAARKAEEAARRAEAQAAADAEARAISGDLGRMAGNASASGQVDKGIIDKLNSAAGKLADGTNANEVGGALASLANAVETLDAKQRASLDPVLRRIANLEANLRNNR